MLKVTLWICNNCLQQVKTYKTKNMSKADLKYIKEL